ncbi:MAG: nucleoside-diphosphate sugar epimerase/dehydratase [Paludibacter sp.]|nr:nucleoside-diphosphate sugar epimerase/dehydratase [Paludibacter sp.]
MKEKTDKLNNSDIFSHLISFKYLPRWVVLIIDITVCAGSYFIANYVSTEIFKDITTTDLLSFNQRLVLVLSAQIAFFWLFHTYSGVLRYSGYIDAIKLILAVFINVVFLIVVSLIFCKDSTHCLFYLSGLLLYGFLSFVPLFIIRLTVKTTFDIITQNRGHVIPVMIYGTKQAAIGIAKMLQSQQEEVKYKLVGFIDDDGDASQRIIRGVKVYNLNERTLKNIIVKKTKTVIVTPQKMNQINTESELDIFLNNNISILTLPPMSIWKNDVPTLKQIKSVQIEDLLERPAIEILTDKIAEEINSKVILVTGAAGSIGSELAIQISTYHPKLIILMDQAETPLHYLKLSIEEKFPDQNFIVFIGDVRDKERMEYLMDLYKPDFVFHAAAYKHVPLMEDNPVESVRANVEGTKIMADLAVKYKVLRFVMISTDKAVNPTNIMGASKRIAEIYVQSLNKKLIARGNIDTKFITTRFGNVLGSNGSVIPLFKSQIEKGGPITVTHADIIRYFMTIPEACMLVLEACIMGKGGEIFIFDMGKPVKITTLARKMIKLAGLIPDVDIKIEYTGLRPGEKLFEELLNHKETTIETYNSKIMVAKVQEYDFDDVSEQIDELIKYSHLCKSYMTVSQMKKIVPEFKSKNSQYESLDI